MKTVNSPIALIATFLWIGFVCAISFMEAWLKFNAPGITIPLGLGIGKIVFHALNKVEWIMAIAILINLRATESTLMSSQSLTYFIPLFLIIVQTFWLLPALDVRAELHFHGQSLPPSYLHFYYVGMEIVKVFCLAIFGLSQFKTIPLTSLDAVNVI